MKTRTLKDKILRGLQSTRSTDNLRLDEAVDLIVYGANCDRCHETRRVDLAKLAERFGPDMLVRNVRPRLRCSKCGKRNVIVVTLWKSSSSTGVDER